MPNYSNGKIYKITGTNSEGNSITYYGSTTKKYLCTRLAQHKYISKIGQTNSSKQVVDCEDCQITLIEYFSCESKDELIARERFYIESNECVNKNIPGRSNKEWKLKNRIRLNEYQRNWKHKNKLLVNNNIV